MEELDRRFEEHPEFEKLYEARANKIYNVSTQALFAGYLPFIVLVILLLIGLYLIFF